MALAAQAANHFEARPSKSCSARHVVQTAGRNDALAKKENVVWLVLHFRKHAAKKAATAAAAKKISPDPIETVVEEKPSPLLALP